MRTDSGQPNRPGTSDPQGSNALGLRLPGPRTLWSSMILAGSLGLALATYYGYIGSGLVEYVAEWTASWTSALMNLLGDTTTVRGTILSSESFAVNVVAECTAVGPLVLFIGAVLAYPAPLRTKGIGVVLGLVVLTVVNLVRIMSLFWIGEAYPEYLSIAHLLVWQTAIILLAIVMWLLWVEKVVGARNR